eukprot:TRINITY_DN48275_c0_g1_i1.p1 TRINITY_DN48275_c0_g1~~TRINITY_DN48275_c0_g1_i1.p1  ORF type:complete len:186 (+),score=24.22 TRINITY_DN48275_c0_g1_i1:1-558(+)
MPVSHSFLRRLSHYSNLLADLFVTATGMQAWSRRRCFAPCWIASAIVVSAAAVELTPDSYEDFTAGRTVFIAFSVPWCGYCRKLKPKWDKLVLENEGNEKVLVATVDCDKKPSKKQLCKRYDVSSYPTLLYGTADDLWEYEGDRDHKSLAAMVESLAEGRGPEPEEEHQPQWWRVPNMTIEDTEL